MNGTPEKRLAEMSPAEISAMLCRAQTAALAHIPPDAMVITLIFEGDLVYFATPSALATGFSPLDYGTILRRAASALYDAWRALPTAMGNRLAACRGAG